jgi:dsDNA-specific endonuclease/ATPase MutS2
MIDMSNNDANGAIEIPIDGALDLHNFSPKDLKYLIPDYLHECRKKNILQVRIIHGKGIGNLRRTVHSILKKTPGVKSFRLAGEGRGSWGATMVDLQNNDK